VTADLLDAAPHLKVIARWGVGLENIDLMAAHERGVVVTAARNANATAVAEYVLSAMLHLVRPFTEADVSIRAGQWDRMRFGGTELFNHVLGIIGVGRIGQRVARRAQAFGMHVLGHDPYLGPHDFVQPSRVFHYSRSRKCCAVQILLACMSRYCHRPVTSSIVTRWHFYVLMPYLSIPHVVASLTKRLFWRHWSASNSTALFWMYAKLSLLPWMTRCAIARP